MRSEGEVETQRLVESSDVGAAEGPDPFADPRDKVLEDRAVEIDGSLPDARNALGVARQRRDRPVVRADGVDQVLLFVIDILNEEATLLVPNDLVKTVAEKSFDADVQGDTVVLPGIMSRKKQIIPNLAV